jgi:tetratricopeptide (TPR) repeat protein
MKLADLLYDRFEIEQQISTGGMGQVFRARDRVSGEAVAVKVLSDERDHRIARFAREIDLLSELSHPAIVRYLSHGAMASGELFLAMEWLEGEDLKARLERAPLTMSESITLATRVAEALGAAHARGIVHRDLKPSNLFLPEGRIEHVKVLDFGIAQKDGRTQLTHTGTIIGTPGYMAPEQARTHGAVDARADVFALGCVLFQCLTGTPAFEGETAIAILAQILFSEAPRVSELWPEVPEELDALVAQMLSKDPAFRPSDGTHLATALTALPPRVHGTAAAASARQRKLSAITGSERRFRSVVLLGRATEPDEQDEQIEEALRRTIKPYSGHAEEFADGSTIVVLETDRQVATDQAAQAARCALAMRTLAKGRAMAIAMGRADSTRQLPEGDVIDRASRLLSSLENQPGDLPPIALDEVSAGLLDARFDVVESEAGFLLLGEHALMQGARTLLGRPTSCVGRDWELGALTGILDDCIEEPEARAVVVTAAAGMGKSRLGAEFVSRVQQRGEDVAIWVGRGDSLRAGSTLDLLAQALRGALGIQGGEPLAERRERIRARVAEHVPHREQKRVTEFLGELVGTPFPGDDEGDVALKAARQDAQLMSEQMRKAWLDFLNAETSVHPVLLLLEDLHWGDFGTVRFIDTALRDRSDRSWMVLALARPEVYEVFPKLWGERQNVQEIRLKELGRKASERLVRQVLGDSVGPETIERMLKQADGNAFYLEELIRAVAEGKEKALPETVLAMVETRLARLPLEARRVLRAASVFGEVCWEGGVTVLLAGAMGPAVVGEWLARLVEQEVLTMRPESRFSGERELKFRHALLREGAYATLTEDDKRLGNLFAGKWLKQRHETDPMVLAGHFERGGKTRLAAAYYYFASGQAFQVLDLDAIMARTKLGLDYAPPQKLRHRLLGMRCEASTQGLHLAKLTETNAAELIREAPRGSVPWAQAVGPYNYGKLIAGKTDDLLASIAVLQQVDLPPGKVGRMNLVLVNGIWSLDALGHVVEATVLEKRFLAAVQSTGDREPMTVFWWNVIEGTRAAYAHEDPWKALVHSDAIQPIFDATSDERMFLNMQLFRGLNLWHLGAFAAAEQKLEEIVTADWALGIVGSLRRFALSWLRADRGALDEAHVLATQLSEYGQAHDAPLDEGRGRWVLAEVLRRMRDLEGAEREIKTGLGILRTTMPLEQPGALGTLSALRLAQGRAEEALAAAEQAISRSTTMGGCGMFRGAFIRLAHAEALHATGAHDAARHAITEARARLFAIADRIPDPDYKKSFLENVPENARTLMLARAWLGEA